MGACKSKAASSKRVGSGATGRLDVCPEANPNSASTSTKAPFTATPASQLEAQKKSKQESTEDQGDPRDGLASGLAGSGCSAAPQGSTTRPEDAVLEAGDEAAGEDEEDEVAEGYQMGDSPTSGDLEAVRGEPQEGGLIARPLVTLSNGVTYVGQWRGNKKHGYGVQQWPDGAKYVGEWVDGFAEGRGVFTHADGDYYDGQWKGDKANGYGVYRHSDGSEYRGNWLNDRKHGEARERWQNGSHFEGTYVMGKKEGLGTFTWPEGSHYTGQFHQNDIDGEGRYVWADGRCYEGQWRKNRMQGKGVFTWPDGRVYSGEYVADKKHGEGKFTWTDGRSFTGQWVNGKQHGTGQYTSAKGEKKKGRWENGKRIAWIPDEDEEDEEDLNQGSPTREGAATTRSSSQLAGTVGEGGGAVLSSLKKEGSSIANVGGTTPSRQPSVQRTAAA